MGRLKQKLFKGLAGVLLAGSLLFPRESQAQERVIIDLYSQPNDSTLNYYGSGIQTQDGMDIDGDGASSTPQDTIILGQFSRGEIYSLPSNWNKLTNSEKQKWFNKMESIDKTDTISSTICYDFSNPFAINFHGFKSLEDGVGPAFPWKFSKNNRFNIPVCIVSTSATGYEPHAINGVLIGEDPLNFNDWYFFDPRFSTSVSPGDWNMINGSQVKIKYIWDIDKNTGSVSSSNIIVFDLDEFGNPSLLETPYLNHVVKSNPNKDSASPEVDLSVKDSIYNKDVNLEYLVKENQTFLDSAYFKLDDNEKQNISCGVPHGIILAPVDSISGTIPLTDEEGEHNLFFYASDIANPKNTTTKSINFIIDKTAPTTYDNIPTEWQNSDFKVVLTPSDAISGVASTKYCISSTNDCTPDIEYTSPIPISEEGEKYFRYFSTDSVGNNQPIVTKILKLDKTQPELQIHSPENKDYLENINELKCTATDPNLDSCFYSTDNGQTKEYFPCSSGLEETLNLNSVEGENIWTIYAKDKAKNVSEKSVVFNVLPNSINEETQENHFKAYPNPVSGTGNFEFYLQNSQDIKLSIYDVSGRELEKRIFDCNQGENRISYDFSKYSQGIYLYRFETSEGEKTGKILKK